MRDLDTFEALTFDCFGTLIDWESGILASLRPLLEAHGQRLDDNDILEQYAHFESTAQAGSYCNYRTILRRVVDAFGEALGFTPGEVERRSLEDSIATWKPFPDTVESLRALQSRYELVIISNVDDDLFVEPARKLEVPFHRIFTAEQARAYKPSPIIFEYALKKLEIPPARVLHVAQSLYHDVPPARALGMSTVWVDRRHGRSGCGATPPTDAEPDLVVTDLRALAVRMNLL